MHAMEPSSCDMQPTYHANMLEAGSQVTQGQAKTKPGPATDRSNSESKPKGASEASSKRQGRWVNTWKVSEHGWKERKSRHASTHQRQELGRIKWTNAGQEQRGTMKMMVPRPPQIYLLLVRCSLRRCSCRHVSKKLTAGSNIYGMCGSVSVTSLE